MGRAEVFSYCWSTKEQLYDLLWKDYLKYPIFQERQNIKLHVRTYETVLASNEGSCRQLSRKVADLISALL